MKKSRGIQSLYIELILTLIVLGFGSAVLSAIKSVPEPEHIDLDAGEVAAYVLNGTNYTIIANWGNDPEDIEVVCVDQDGYVSTITVSIGPESTYLLQVPCSGELLFLRDDAPIPVIVIMEQ